MSATKVNTYAGSFGCPRRFYNQYILRLKQRENINFPIGNQPHRAFESCFKLKIHLKHEMYSDFRREMLSLNDVHWNSLLPQIQRLKPENLSESEIYEDSRKMVINWVNSYLRSYGKDPEPLVEKTVWARKLKLMCRIDYGGKGFSPGEFHIIDYKTGKSNKIYKDTKIQLICNWLCYREDTGSTTHKVGAHFVRYQDDPVRWTPTKEEIQWALDKIEFVRNNTRSTDISDYPCTCGGKCQDDFILNENG